MAFTWVIIWAVVACMFAIMLGYSRIPFAAAREGDFFSIFGRLHPRGGYPYVSLLTLGGLTAIGCYFPLQKVIDASVAVRILIQFIGQTVGLHLVHKTRPDIPLPFRMRLYPLPSLIAIAGWLFLLGTSDWRCSQSPRRNSRRPARLLRLEMVQGISPSPGTAVPGAYHARRKLRRRRPVNKPRHSFMRSIPDRDRDRWVSGEPVLESEWAWEWD